MIAETKSSFGRQVIFTRFFLLAIVKINSNWLKGKNEKITMDMLLPGSQVVSPGICLAPSLVLALLAVDSVHTQALLHSGKILSCHSTA